ncbi:MAG TPA: glycosyltransferase family 4 protein [Ferruginibacter sp.]|nr:glycosyltransferase family 4 protein [Ferruginibacter sp.]
MSKRIVIIENNIIATNTIRYKLTRLLMDKGYQVTVLTTGPAKELQQARDNGFHVVDVGSSNSNPLDIQRYMRHLRKGLKNAEADVCLTFTIRPAIWGNIVTRRLGIPTITNITGIGPLFASNNIAYRAARTMYKFVLKKTAHIFFQNNDDMKLFLDNGFVLPQKAERIPGSGIDPVHYAPMEKTGTDTRFVFLFIGRLVKDKGILEYVEAARLLKKQQSQVVCKVLGPLWTQNLKGNTVTQEELNSWIGEGVIEYLGETADVRPFIAAADSVVLPSYREGTSNILLEASSMERPCITCDTTGCREIVDDGETGFLCKVADARDLADKMATMANLPAAVRQSMGKKARKKVTREYNKQMVVDAYIRAIERV